LDRLFRRLDGDDLDDLLVPRRSFEFGLCFSSECCVGLSVVVFLDWSLLLGFDNGDLDLEPCWTSFVLDFSTGVSLSRSSLSLRFFVSSTFFDDL